MRTSKGDDSLRLERVRRAIGRETEKRRLLDSGLLLDPAWDILLHVYAAELQGHALRLMDLSHLRLATRSILRWVDALASYDLIPVVHEGGDPTFGLSPNGLRQMEHYFDGPGDE